MKGLKLIHAAYGDPDRALIRAVYTDKDGNMVAHMHSNNPKDAEIKQIMKAYTEYDLAKNYVDDAREDAAMRQILAGMNASVMPNYQIVNLIDHLAKSDPDLQEYDKVIKYLQDHDDPTVEYIQSEPVKIDYTFDQLMEIFEERENLFKLKLSMFEMDDVKKADRKIKSQLRKSNDVVELFGLLYNLRNSSDSEQSESED